MTDSFKMFRKRAGPLIVSKCFVRCQGQRRERTDRFKMFRKRARPQIVSKFSARGQSERERTDSFKMFQKRAGPTERED